MTVAARLELRDGFTATFDEELVWSHPEKETQEMLQRITESIVDGYNVARGDRVVWFFEEVVRFLDVKKSKLFYKIPKRLKGDVDDG